MTQKLVVQRCCERCPRVDSHEVNIDAVREKAFSLEPSVKSIRIEVDGELIGEYEYLCAVCRDVVNNYVVSILQPLDKVSAHRKKKTASDKTKTKTKGNGKKDKDPPPVQTGRTTG